MVWKIITVFQELQECGLKKNRVGRRLWTPPFFRFLTLSFPFSRVMSFLRVVARAAPVRPFVQVQAPRFALQSLARARLPPRAFFAAAAGGPRKEEIEARILDIVKSFEKVEPEKVSRKPSSSLVRPQNLHRMFWSSGRPISDSIFLTLNRYNQPLPSKNSHLIVLIPSNSSWPSKR